jgi:hypothetical protein
MSHFAADSCPVCTCGMPSFGCSLIQCERFFCIYLQSKETLTIAVGQIEHGITILNLCKFFDNLVSLVHEFLLVLVPGLCVGGPVFVGEYL